MGSYTVKSGDSYESIAGRVYKDQRYANLIVKANKGAALHPNMVINIPEVEKTERTHYVSYNDVLLNEALKFGYSANRLGRLTDEQWAEARAAADRSLPSVEPAQPTTGTTGTTSTTTSYGGGAGGVQTASGSAVLGEGDTPVTGVPNPDPSLIAIPYGSQPQGAVGLRRYTPYEYTGKEAPRRGTIPPNPDTSPDPPLIAIPYGSQPQGPKRGGGYGGAPKKEKPVSLGSITGRDLSAPHIPIPFLDYGISVNAGTSDTLAVPFPSIGITSPANSPLTNAVANATGQASKYTVANATGEASKLVSTAASRRFRTGQYGSQYNVQGFSGNLQAGRSSVAEARAGGRYSNGLPTNQEALINYVLNAPVTGTKPPSYLSWKSNYPTFRQIGGGEGYADLPMDMREGGRTYSNGGQPINSGQSGGSSGGYSGGYATGRRYGSSGGSGRYSSVNRYSPAMSRSGASLQGGRNSPVSRFIQPQNIFSRSAVMGLVSWRI